MNRLWNWCLGSRCLGASLKLLLLLVVARGAWADNHDLLQAQAAYQRGDLQALAGYAQSMQGDPLGMYPRYWLINRQLESIDNGTVLAFLNANQGSWLAEKLRGDWLRVLGHRGDWATFRSQYPLLLDAPGTDLVCYNYSARIAGGDKQALREARTELWFTPKDQPSSCDPVIDALVNTNTVVEPDMWARLRLAFEGNVQGMVHHLSELLNEPIAQDTLNRIDRNPDGFLNDAPMNTRMEREVAIFAISRLARTDVDAAYRHMIDLQERMGAQRGYAWRELAVGGARKGDPRALDWFKASNGQAYSDYQQEWHIRAALRVQDWDAVIDGIHNLSDASRTMRSWQYWLARAEENRKAGADASRIYAELSRTDDYYGLLALDRLGPVASPVPPSYRANVTDLQRVKDNPGLQRALTLYEMELRPEGVREWNWALRGADDRLLLAAAEQANAVGWYDRAIYAAEHCQRLSNFALRYPAPYRQIASNYADKVGLDDAWVFGLMRQESRFSSSARSGVGAGGLMQLMPSTAQWVANRLGVRYRSDMLSDVDRNVQFGTYYLRHVQDNLNSSAVLATAAYNAGPNRAREWQGDQPMEAAIYIETIPIFETRDYVRKVMANSVYYALSFGRGRQSLTQRMGMIPARGSQPITGP